MSYKNYQPGLARRLKYSIELYERRRRRVSTQIPSQQPFIVASTAVMKNSFVKGLMSEKLLHNSSVHVLLHDINNFNNTHVCPICIEPFVVYDIYRKLVCNHTFHVKCIDKWFVNETNCPYCRRCI